MGLVSGVTGPWFGDPDQTIDDSWISNMMWKLQFKKNFNDICDQLIKWYKYIW